MKKLFFVLAVVGMCVANVEAGPDISGVTIRQRWPWSHLVDIDFVAANATEPFDVTVQAWNGNSALTLPAASLSGTYSVSTNFGVHRIVFDPLKTSYTNAEVLSNFRVLLTATNEPLYMIVDLTKAAGAEGQIEYVYESDLTNGLWGTWARDPVTNKGTVVKSVIWTGVTNGTVYKTDKLVLRRIHAGSFLMGGYKATTLTKDFYEGVFEVTQRQWQLITGKRPSSFKNNDCYQVRPVENVSYDALRGMTNDTPAIDWPGTGTAVSTNSFLGMLRAATGMAGFDLPTEAQWEYACRAGTTTTFYDGNSAANVAGVNAGTNAWLDVLGRYKFNGGFLPDGITEPARASAGVTNGTAEVGSYRPNAWGIYDTLGNVQEWVLNWFTGTPEGGVNPAGPVTAVNKWRTHRGSSWVKPASESDMIARDCGGSNGSGDSMGIRLVLTLP